LQNIKLSSDLALSGSEPQILQAPDSLRVDLVKVAVSDIFFAEDFEKLQVGLNRLFKEFPPYIEIHTLQDLNIWFKEIAKVEAQGGYQRINLGLLTLNKKISAYFSDIHLNLFYYYPSIIILTACGNSSIDLRNRFTNLTRSNPKSELEVNLLRDFLGWSRISGMIVRKRQIDELFMEINQSIVQLFREVYQDLAPFQ
jgi:hypothetical protein